MSSLRRLVGKGMGSIAVEAVYSWRPAAHRFHPPAKTFPRNDMCSGALTRKANSIIILKLYSPITIFIPSEYALNSGAYWHWIKA